MTYFRTVPPNPVISQGGHEMRMINKAGEAIKRCLLHKLFYFSDYSLIICFNEILDHLQSRLDETISE